MNNIALALVFLFPCGGSAQVLRSASSAKSAPAQAVPLVAPALGAPGLGTALSAPSLTATLPGAPAAALALPRTQGLPAALPASALPASKAAPVSPELQPAPATVGPRFAAPQAAMERASRREELAPALKKDASSAQKGASLGLIFDGMDAGAPAAGGINTAAKDFTNAFGIYSWLTALPELAAPGAKAPVTAARVILGVRPLLEKGPVILMKDGDTLTAISAKDPSIAPIVLTGVLSSKEAPTQAEAVLARKIDAAIAQDKEEGSFFNLAAVFTKLSELEKAPAPVQTDGKPAIPTTKELPADPYRQPFEYLSRLLRDAMLKDDPYAVLDSLADIRRQATDLLNRGDRSSFLERLFAEAEFKARGLMPGLLDSAQAAAAEGDKVGVERAFAAAKEYLEYAPKLKKKVAEAHQKTTETLELLDRLGSIDEKTGLPVRPPAP